MLFDQYDEIIQDLWHKELSRKSQMDNQIRENYT